MRIQPAHQRPLAAPPDSQHLSTASLLRDLQSHDAATRVRAFAHLRRTPRSEVAQAWRVARHHAPRPGGAMDVLGRLEITLPEPRPQSARAIVTVISPGYEPMLASLLDSLERFGDSPEAEVMVFAVDGAGGALRKRPGVRWIECRAIERISPAVKGAIYSCTRFIEAESILSLEADMLVVGSLQPLWTTIESAHPSAIMGCRAQCVPHKFRLSEVLGHMSAPASDLEFLTGVPSWDGTMHFNGGLLAGRRAAWAEMEARLQSMVPWVQAWVEGGTSRAFNDEFAMNVAVSLMENRVELSPVWNVQFYDQNRDHWVQSRREAEGVQYLRLGEPAKVLHFLSQARNFLWDVRRELGLDHGLYGSEVRR